MSEKDNCHVEPMEKPLDEAALVSAQAVYLAVSGMGCPNCAARVRNGLLSIDGVLLADVNLGMNIAAAAYDPERVTPEDLTQAVTDAGNDGRHHYVAEVVKVLPAKDALRW